MPKGDATCPTMTIDECLAFADEWSRGMTLYPGAQGWRVVCMLLADEVRGLRSELDEQCRLNGMGSEREARLMAQIAESQARERRMREALMRTQIGGCSCLTKTPDPSYHQEHCGYRVADEALAIPCDDSILREMIEAARKEERERIVNLLSGIDRQQSDDDEGWWETSAGSEFGAEILNKIRSRSDK